MACNLYNTFPHLRLQAMFSKCAPHSHAYAPSPSERNAIQCQRCGHVKRMQTPLPSARSSASPTSLQEGSSSSAIADSVRSAWGSGGANSVSASCSCGGDHEYVELESCILCSKCNDFQLIPPAGSTTRPQRLDPGPSDCGWGRHNYEEVKSCVICRKCKATPFLEKESPRGPHSPASSLYVNISDSDTASDP